MTCEVKGDPMIVTWQRRLFMILVVGAIGSMSIGADGPRPQGAASREKGPFGKKADPTLAADQETFHFLLAHHKSIQRSVEKIANGVVTITESNDPEVAKKIQEHVRAMYERVKSGKGLRYWDPLFVEVFKHGPKMKMEIVNTEKGVKVTETSDDAEVVKLIQAHAEVVSRFVEKGFEEAHEKHPVPTEHRSK